MTDILNGLQLQAHVPGACAECNAANGVIEINKSCMLCGACFDKEVYRRKMRTLASLRGFT